MRMRFLSKKKKPQPKSRAGAMLQILRKQGISGFRIEAEKQFITLPSPDDVNIKNAIYPLLKPYAYTHIKWDEEEGMLVYDLIEPRLGEEEKKTLEKIKEGMVQVIDISLEDIRNEGKIIEFLEENVRSLLKEFGIMVSQKEYSKLMYYVYRDFVGMNKIEPLFSDPYIEDIGCDGVDVPVYLVHQKFGSLRTNIIYKSEEELRDFVTKLAERCNRYISYAEPMLDGTLPDGSRVQASLASDVTTRGPTYSIRKFKEEPFSPVDMIRLNTASPELLAYLWYIVENYANVLIAGGVATGKTSFLNAISLFIPPEDKIISIEDTREINLPHENWVPGVSRTGFTGSKIGEVGMFELLRESFRQNPDYLIVGEVRGKEAYVMFQGMASGHPSISTLHAGSVEDVIRRLQTRPINLSVGLLESLDIVIVMVHAREKGKSSRRVKEISEIEKIDPETGNVRAVKSFVWIPHDDSYEYRGRSWVLSKISRDKGTPLSDILEEIKRRKRLINWLYQNNIADHKKVSLYFSRYNRDPDTVMKVVEGKLLPDDLNE